jgi:alkylation response protein AidB-like acyl-CoA dehydrogenase
VSFWSEEQEALRDSARAFVRSEIAPYLQEWEDAGEVPRDLHAKAAKLGFLGLGVPEEYGGSGGTFLDSLACSEAFTDAGASSGLLAALFTSGIALPHIVASGDRQLIDRYVRPTLAGETIGSLAVTEPGGGSDVANIRTTAVRDGDHYVVNGAKTFITNGINADLVITAVKTDPSQKHKGMSLIILERGMDGFERGRNLEKIGQHAQDTAELFFTDVQVPVANLLGPNEGEGFLQLVDNLPQERLSIAAAAVAAARAALGWTLDYVKQRTAFGQPVGSFQNSKFVLAEIDTELDIAQTYVDACVTALNAGTLTAEEAAKAKWWCTEFQKRTVDRCLQLHGGYGYMLEYPIARAYTDARITTIYGGTTEIMKEIIGKSLGL